MPERLWAVRGAAAADNNSAAAIKNATAKLLEALRDENRLDRRSLVSMIFTATPDLNAAFPAAAARDLGFAEVPLICAQEIPVPGSPPRLVRVMVHYYGSPTTIPKAVYLGAARQLRPDLTLAPSEILDALRELERERTDGPFRRITTTMLTRRALGKSLLDRVSTSERELFTRNVRVLQMRGRAGYLTNGASEDWFEIGRGESPLVRSN